MRATVRCTACDTYNRMYRITCMACDQPMPQIVTARVRAARTGIRLARIASYCGYGIATLILLVSFIRHGAEPDQGAGLAAAASVGFGHLLAFVLEGLTAWLLPARDPDWREAADGLKQLASDLAALDAAHAVDQLDRHGGIEPLAIILAAIGKRAETERADADRHGNDIEAAYQVQMRESAYDAVNSLLSDQARRTNWR